MPVCVCVVRQFHSTPRIPHRLCALPAVSREMSDVRIVKRRKPIIYIAAGCPCCQPWNRPVCTGPLQNRMSVWAIYAGLPKEILFDCRTIALYDLNRFGEGGSPYIRQFIRPTFAPSLRYCNNLIHTDDWIYAYKANIGSTAFRPIYIQ